MDKNTKNDSLPKFLISEEENIINAINESKLTTMRVVGRGTLTVDVAEVMTTHAFQYYAKQAQKIKEETEG